MKPPRPVTSRLPSRLLLALACTAFALVGFECDAFERHVQIMSSSAQDTIVFPGTVTIGVTVAERIDVERIELYDRRVMVEQSTDRSYAYDWRIDYDDNGKHRWQAFVWDTSGYVWPTEILVHEVAIESPRSGPPPESTVDVEQRCDELGDACLMSETLDTEEYVSVNAQDIDFANSTSKEATRAWTRHSVEPVHTGDARVAMPAGSSVSWVLQSNEWGHGTGHMNLSSDIVPPGTRRLCVRSYIRFSEDFVSMGQGTDTGYCGANKIMELFHGSTDVQLSNTGGDNIQLWCGPYSTCPVSNELDEAQLAGGAGIAACTHSWCRAEMCLSGDVAGSGPNALEGYVEQVGVANPGRKEFVRTNVGHTHGALSEIWPATGYRQCEGSDLGVKWISHAMVAAWPSDEGQFVGRSREVEGQL